MLTDDELDILEDTIGDIYPDGLDETELNDLLRFEGDTIADWLGYNDYEDMLQQKAKKEEEEEEGEE